MNLTMVCSYSYYCIDLPVEIVDCQVEDFPSRLHHVFQVEYVLQINVDFNGTERKICHNCVDELQGQGKSIFLNKLGDSTVYEMD